MNKKGIKIVYCLSSLKSSGGTERVITTKANFLSALPEYKVYIVLKNGAEDSFFSLSQNVECIALGAESEKEYRKKLTAVLYGIKPHITISAGGSELSYLPRLRDGSKKIFEFHYTRNFLINFVRGIKSIRFKQLHLLKVWLLQKRLFFHARRFDKLVLLTERDRALWHYPPHSVSIYNPLSFRSVQKSTTRQKTIIAVGSFTPAKGMDRLVEAFGRIAPEYPEWRLELYGAGQDLPLLKSLIRKYALEERASLNPPCRNIGEKLVEAGIYAFPSRSDGFGLVLTEAMECGLPLVAFDCECGPREILTPDSGILVPQDDIALFARALARLMSDDELRARMGELAQCEVSRFYTEAIMPSWCSLFDELLETKR